MGGGGGLIRNNMETRSKHHVFSLGENLKKKIYIYIYTDQSGIKIIASDNITCRDK